MNQKIAIFSFVALPSPSTKTNHPRWDLGKDFFASLYRKIKDQNPRISEDFTKTFLKWPRDGLETTWRQCWSALVSVASFCAFFIAESRQAFLFVNCVCLSSCKSSDWDWLKYARCKRLLLVKSFYLFLLLKNYFRFRTTNVFVKTDYSASLRWNITFWTFPKRSVFFW